MKPLLRAVLVIDALLLLAFGLLFLLTPWTSLYNALQLVQVDPTLVGQAFGLALLGLAWLAFHAAIDGAMTRAVARVVGHVNWLTGVLMLVWLVGLHKPSLTAFGQLVSAVVALVLVIIGLGGVRLAGVVRRRERARVAEVAAAGREQKRIGKETANTRQADRELNRGVDSEPRVYGTEQATATSRSVSPATGLPTEPSFTAGHQPGSATVETRTTETARDEARDAAADTPGAPRPPFHG
ncbi:hypothetical protein [Paraburkholderia sartisoli]|uniref:Transmembrane protein n=1 Tax=Paraburkholderia sartisoli TaxID=83784 RepID=A0A1H4AZK8_9BURK|nr:hypothetical protein [Paraburkholderia sartisoli]SEA41266.1 hypothetical protein SAMN05192564_1011384 [Paraburkholderia sartisoli]